MWKWLNPANIKNGTISGILLVLFVIGLYVLQNKAITPLVENVAKSDLFVEDTSDIGDKDRSKLALLQCNDFVRAEVGENQTVAFESKDFHTWELGGGQYLVRSHVTEQDESGSKVQKNYACSVQFTGGDDTTHENWTLKGLDIVAP